MAVLGYLSSGTVALTLALRGEPPPLVPGGEAPGGYHDMTETLPSEPDDGHTKVTLGSILFSLGALRVGAGVAQYITATPRYCEQVYGNVEDSTCNGLRIYGLVGLGFGGLMFATGVGFLTWGLLQRSKHRAWLRERGMSFGPMLGPGQQGVSFGFRF